MKNIIKNLHVNNIALYSAACYGTAVLLPVVGMKMVDDDFPYIGKDPKYPEHIVIVDQWEGYSVEDSGYYTRDYKYYDLDEEDYYILDAFKDDVDKMEVALGECDSIVTEVFNGKLSDSDKELEKKVLYPERLSKKEIGDRISKLLICVGLTGLSASMASILVEEKEKSLRKF